MLRSNLLGSLERFAKGQAEMNADIQKLMAIVSGDQKLLQDIFGSVENIEKILEQGVDLSDETYARLSGLIMRQAESSRKVRAIALRTCSDQRRSRTQVTALPTTVHYGFAGMDANRKGIEK